MTPEQLHLSMIRFESRAGASEGRMTYDSGVMRNVGPRPDELGHDLYPADAASSGGHVLYELAAEGWTVSFYDPE